MFMLTAVENVINLVILFFLFVGVGPSEEFESKEPKKIPFFNSEVNGNHKVFKICCGGMHTLVLTTMGKIFSWGNNDDKALGRVGDDNIPILVDKIEVPMNEISAGDSHSIAYNTDLNVLYQWGSYRVIYYLFKLEFERENRK